MALQRDHSRIYVADLAAYTAGALRGRWFNVSDYAMDAGGDYDETRDLLAADIASYIRAIPGREEYAIHDYDGPIARLGGALGEYPSLDVVVYHAMMMDEHPAEPWAIWVTDIIGVLDPDDASPVAFEESFCGWWDSGADYAAEMVGETTDLDQLPDVIRYHIDWDGVWRDMELGDGYMITDNGAVFGPVI